MASREEREQMREAAEQLRQQRYDRIQARLNEEAAINEAARDEESSDRSAADFLKQFKGMSAKQQKKAAEIAKKDMSPRQRRAFDKAAKRRKGK